MPSGIYALAVAAFAVGLAEFIAVGILPALASGLQTNIPSAGLSLTVYALGVALTGPVLSVITSQVDRRKLALVLMMVFIASNIACVIAPDLTMLLIARVAAGMVQGVFFGMGTLIAAGMVKPEKSGQAIATMFTGMTLALLAGVPLGKFVSAVFDWRAAFMTVTIAGITALLAVAMLLPAGLERPPQRPLRSQFGILFVPRMWLVFSVTATGHCGAFIALTYLSEILQSRTGFTEAGASMAFVVYGAGVMIGNTVFARMADKHGPVTTLTLIYGLLCMVLASVSLFSGNAVVMLFLLILWGATAFGNVPVLQLYAVNQAQKLLPGSEQAASAINVSAFHTGIAAGSSLGAVIIAKAGLSYIAPCGAAIVGLNVMLVFLNRYFNTRDSSSGRKCASAPS